MRSSARANWKRFWKPPGLRPRRRRSAAPLVQHSDRSSAAPRTRRRRQLSTTETHPRASRLLAARRRPARAAGPLSRATHGTARRHCCRRISTTRPRRACSPPAALRRIIKIAEGCDHPCTFCIIPQPARQVPLAPVRVGRRRGGATGRARRARDHAHRPGHHLLRRRPRH